MLNINTNYGAAFAAKAAKSTNNDLNTAFERLSSGSRINFESLATDIVAENQFLVP